MTLNQTFAFIPPRLLSKYGLFLLSVTPLVSSLPPSPLRGAALITASRLLLIHLSMCDTLSLPLHFVPQISLSRRVSRLNNCVWCSRQLLVFFSFHRTSGSRWIRRPDATRPCAAMKTSQQRTQQRKEALIEEMVLWWWMNKAHCHNSSHFKRFWPPTSFERDYEGTILLYGDSFMFWAPPSSNVRHLLIWDMCEFNSWTLGWFNGAMLV